MDVDPGLSTNRTVYTFVGSPDAVIEGALNGARAAMTLIDMRRHRGRIYFLVVKSLNVRHTNTMHIICSYCDYIYIMCYPRY